MPTPRAPHATQARHPRRRRRVTTSHGRKCGSAPCHPSTCCAACCSPVRSRTAPVLRSTSSRSRPMVLLTSGRPPTLHATPRPSLRQLPQVQSTPKLIRRRRRPRPRPPGLARRRSPHVVLHDSKAAPRNLVSRRGWCGIMRIRAYTRISASLRRRALHSKYPTPDLRVFR